MIVALGHSEELESHAAVADALDQCAAVLGELSPQAGVLYAGIDHEHQLLLDAVEARFPGCQLIGCTTHGEVSSHGFADDSVVLMLFQSDRVEFGAGVGEGVPNDPEGAVQRALEEAGKNFTKPIRLCITVPEGIGTNTTVVLDRIGSHVGPGVPVCGGLAGDQYRSKQTFQYCNGKVYRDAIPVLLFAGPVLVSVGVASGWEPMGGSHVVNKASGPLIAEIDGESARDFWVRYLGSTDLSGSRNCFAVYLEDDEKLVSDDASVPEFSVSAPFFFQPDGQLFMAPPVPEGARIRFADGTREQVLAGVGVSAGRARDTFPGDAPDAALVFSCAGRHAMLGTRVSKELEEFQEHLGADVPTAGFYSSAELCPLSVRSKPRAHGGSFVTVLVGEAD